MYEVHVLNRSRAIRKFSGLTAIVELRHFIASIISFYARKCMSSGNVWDLFGRVSRKISALKRLNIE